MWRSGAGVTDGTDEVASEAAWPPPPPAGEAEVGTDLEPDVEADLEPDVEADLEPDVEVAVADVPGVEVTDTAAAAVGRRPDALRRLASAGSPRERFTVLAELAEVPLDGDALVTLLDALPPGWQRRTALRTLVRGGGDVADLDAAEVLARFERRSERSAVAGLLVGAGLAHLGTVVDHLDGIAAARLRRRRG